jgi:Holliday junction resolvasome RuvABC endonuclease subunit
MNDALGLDLSLTSTGTAINGATGRVHFKERGYERLALIRDAILGIVLVHQPAIVVAEGYSFGSPQQAHYIGELGGVVRLALWEHGIPFAVVPPTCLKKFATGKGNAKKDEVLAAAIRTFGFAGCQNDEADAWILREMGLAYMGLRPTTKARQEVLDKVEWPTP